MVAEDCERSANRYCLSAKPPAMPTTDEQLASLLRVLRNHEARIKRLELAAKNADESSSLLPNPIVNTVAVPTRVQTVEQTAKRWKFAMLVGAIMCMVSVVVVIASSSGTTSVESQGQSMAVAILTFILGLILLICARVGAWWFHG
jgi:hypothetical protein